MNETRLYINTNSPEVLVKLYKSYSAEFLTVRRAESLAHPRLRQIQGILAQIVTELRDDFNLDVEDL